MPARLGRRSRDSTGSVTAETALALPTLVLVLALALSAVHVVTAQMRCVDSAREVARRVARGDSVAAARAAGARVAPPQAVLTVTVAGGTVVVRVRAAVHGFGPLPPWPVTAAAQTELESSATGASPPGANGPVRPPGDAR